MALIVFAMAAVFTGVSAAVSDAAPGPAVADDGDIVVCPDGLFWPNGVCVRITATN